jgi:DNA-binding NarL/FixJ family response regulator
MNGFDLLAWIRGHPEFKTLQVFVWTDSGDHETLDRATRAGADRFVPKSVAFVRGGLAGLVRAISEAIIPRPAGKGSLSAKNSQLSALAAGTSSTASATQEPKTSTL